jgi:hypothetical protein
MPLLFLPVLETILPNEVVFSSISLVIVVFIETDVVLG